ncbi:MAG: glycosyltransferase family 39 protein, partial [Anaerolineae bacterium]|nr:glycosyltransferase family 39 protein [Anaerolineae bacterium]
MTNRLTAHPFPGHALVALLLAFFAFFMSAWVSRGVFERMPHLEDEMAYLYQARMYAGGNLVIPSPEPRRAYWQPFLVDYDGARFGKYTPGWSLLLAAGTLMGQEWLINAFLSTLNVALVYRLGREVFDPDTGLIAAALVTFSPMALLLNGTLMGHTSALFAATLFLYACWRIERGRRARTWGVVAGVALGLLIINRPITAIAVSLPLIVWSGLRLVRALAWTLSGGRDRDAADDREQALRAMKAKTVEIPRVALPTLPKTAPLGSTRQSFGTMPTARMSAVTQAIRSAAPAPTAPSMTPIRRARGARGFFPTLIPLLILSVFALIIAAIVPLNNYLATGSPTKDLYTLVWSYDQIGFGTCCGRSGHTLEKGIRQARYDLSLTAADLFGWEIGTLTQPDGTIKPEVQNHLINEGNYWEEIGISWALLPFAIFVAYRRKAIFVLLWLAGAYGWVRFALDFQGGAQLQNPYFAWVWLITALVWLYLPLVFWHERRRSWTWLLWSAAVGLVVIHMAYWVGSQRYSTRYFFEGLTAIAIISALPLAWLARRVNRPLVYALLALALAYGLYFYSTPRIGVLRGYNFMSQEQIEAVQARRVGDQPVLVIVNGSG